MNHKRAGGASAGPRRRGALWLDWTRAGRNARRHFPTTPAVVEDPRPPSGLLARFSATGCSCACDRHDVAGRLPCLGATHAGDNQLIAGPYLT